MDGEDSKAQEPEGEGGQEGKEPLGGEGAGGGQGDAGAKQQEFEAAMAEKDKRIAELEAKIAEAAKTAEATEKLTREIGELKAQQESDRVGYELKLAGCRSVRAGKALLEEHDGDIEAMRKAEPWLFGRSLTRRRGPRGFRPRARPPMTPPSSAGGASRASRTNRRKQGVTEHG